MIRTLLSTSALVAFAAASDAGSVHSKVLTKPTFIDGSLFPAGTPVEIDTTPGPTQTEVGTFGDNVADPGTVTAARPNDALPDQVTLPNGMTLFRHGDGSYAPRLTEAEVRTALAQMNAEGGHTPVPSPSDIAGQQLQAGLGGDDEAAALTAQIEAMTKAQLTAWLDAQKVTYETDANKATLVQLVKDNQPDAAKAQG